MWPFLASSFCANVLSGIALLTVTGIRHFMERKIRIGDVPDLHTPEGGSWLGTRRRIGTCLSRGWFDSLSEAACV